MNINIEQLTIKTPFGEIDNYDNYDDLNDDTKAMIKDKVEIASIFLTDEIDISNEHIDIEIKNDILINLFDFESRFLEPLRALAIIEYTNSEIDDITENTANSFYVNNTDYIVLTDDEADDEAEQYVTNMIEYEFEYMNSDIKNTILSDYSDIEFFNDIMHEHNYSYAEDIENESASGYANRLHNELVNVGIMDEPEWPDEDDYIHEIEDYEREEFDEEEPSEEYYDTVEEWQEEHDQWEQNENEFEEEQDAAEEEFNNEQENLVEEAIEEYDAATAEYEQELIEEARDKIDEYADYLDDNYDNGYDYYVSNFGDEEAHQLIIDNNLIDITKATEYVLSVADRSEFIGTSGEEEIVDVEFDGESDTFYIY